MTVVGTSSICFILTATAIECSCVLMYGDVKPELCHQPRCTSKSTSPVVKNGYLMIAICIELLSCNKGFELTHFCVWLDQLCLICGTWSTFAVRKIDRLRHVTCGYSGIIYSMAYDPLVQWAHDLQSTCPIALSVI